MTGQADTVYQYRDETGEHLFDAVRNHNPKGFYQRRPDGRGGYINDIRGVPRVLYRLQELLASDPSEPVFVCEGEKDVEALRELGAVATTSAMGAGKWIDNYADSLVGRHVVVLPDNDKPGRDHAETVARSVLPLAQSVKVVALPGLPEKGDVSDWIAAGGTIERLRRLVSIVPPFLSAGTTGVAAESNLPWETAREIAIRAPDSTEYVAYPFAVAGSVSEIDSAPKRGKTTLVLGMVAAVVHGEKFLGFATEKGPVVYLSEQGAASFRPGLDRAGLLDSDDLHVLSWPQVSGVRWPDVMAAAVAKAIEVGAKLIVVDTLPQWSGLRGNAENDAGAALEAIQPVQEAAGKHGLAVVILRHERKGGGEVGESARGSTAFSGAVDSIFQLRRPEGGTTVNPRLRQLSALSRFSDIPEQLTVELTDEGFVTHGNGAHLALNQAIAAITLHAPKGVENAMKEAELLEAAKVKRTIGQEALAALIKTGTIKRFGLGKRNSPYLYSALTGDEYDADRDMDEDEKLSAAPSSAVAADRNPLPGSEGPTGPQQPGLTIPPARVESVEIAPSLSAATPPLGAAERDGAASDDDVLFPEVA